MAETDIPISEMNDERLSYAFGVVVRLMAQAAAIGADRESLMDLVNRVHAMWEELNARKIYLRKVL